MKAITLVQTEPHFFEGLFVFEAGNVKGPENNGGSSILHPFLLISLFQA